MFPVYEHLTMWHFLPFVQTQKEEVLSTCHFKIWKYQIKMTLFIVICEISVQSYLYI